jgi:hypothetical protein
MKKFLVSLFSTVMISLFLITPIDSLAADDVYYDLGDDSKLYIGALVCKIANCITEGESSDWYNYSTTSENVAGDAGLAQTLVVSPGNTLTFMGATGVEGVAVISPLFGIEFTNGSYLSFDNVFSNMVGDVDYSNVDDDENFYGYYEAGGVQYVALSSDLDNTSESQIGAITATVDSNAPDGTLITGIFYIVDPSQEQIIGFGPQKAMAADGDIYARSEVRMLVSNPAETSTEVAAPTATLPATGAKSQAKMHYIFLLISALLVSGTFYFFKRVKS